MRATSGVSRHLYLDTHVQAAVTACRAALGPMQADHVVAAAAGTTIDDVINASPAGGPDLADPPLTPREWQVAHLVAAGRTNRQIDRRLGISERTAERHVETLRHKLNATSRTRSRRG